MSSARIASGILLSAIMVICAYASPQAQSLPSASMKESLGASQSEPANTLDSLDEVSNEAPAVMRQKCFAALGHEKFCACIASKAMAGTSFENYYRYNFISRKQLSYDRASKTKRNAIDAAMNARRTCAKRYFGKRG
jgi:hypothetical protein